LSGAAACCPANCGQAKAAARDATMEVKNS
jgi:hypothetical protein